MLDRPVSWGLGLGCCGLAGPPTVTAPTVTVACGAGFSGDRIEPAVDLASSGSVDWVVLECLAERTLVHGLASRAADPAAGYDQRLTRRLTPLLPAAAAGNCGVVTNLGAANPAAAGVAVARLARQLGLGNRRVAVVTGDDILDQEVHVEWLPPGRPSGGEWLGVHAYLGKTAIAGAVAEGARVVVTGRVADSTLFAAPVEGLLGGLHDPGLAAATTVGHLLECGGQLTGGNLAASRGHQLNAAELAEIGYPLARLDADGRATIGVLPGKPARLDPLTCTLQLLYEVHDPRRYYTPDAILDFGEVQFKQTGVNEVALSGCRSSGRPPTLKAVGFYRRPGNVADVEIGYAGVGALDRARVAADTLRLRLHRIGISESAVDLVGIDSILGGTTPSVAPPAEVRVHVSARCPDPDLAQAVEDEVYSLTLCGPGGGSALRSERRPNIDVVAGTIGRQWVHEEIGWVDP